MKKRKVKIFYKTALFVLLLAGLFTFCKLNNGNTDLTDGIANHYVNGFVCELDSEDDIEIIEDQNVHWVSLA